MSHFLRWYYNEIAINSLESCTKAFVKTDASNNIDVGLEVVENKMAAPQASNAIVMPSHTWGLPTWGRISRQVTFVNSTHSTFLALATDLVFNLDF